MRYLIALLLLCVACGPSPRYSENKQMAESVLESCRLFCHDYGGELMQIDVDASAGFVRTCGCSIRREFPKQLK